MDLLESGGIVKDLVNMLTYTFFKLQNRITTYAFQQDIGLMYLFFFCFGFLV